MSRANRDTDEYYEEDEFTEVNMDRLLEEWRDYLPQALEPFNLIMSEYRGGGSEQALNDIMRGGIRNVEREYPNIMDLAHERIYMKFWQTVYKFLKSTGYTIKKIPGPDRPDALIRGDAWDARAEIGFHEKYFWDEFMKAVEQIAIHNVWDLFDYKVAVITFKTPLNFIKSKYGDGVVVSKDAALNNFMQHAPGSNVTFQKFFSKSIPIEAFPSPQGFVAGIVGGDEIVKAILSGEDHVTTDSTLVGIHSWLTGCGKAYRIGTRYQILFATSYVDDPEHGVIVHHRGRIRTRKTLV